MGVINLTKGGKVNLTKETPGLKKIIFGLGWKCNRYSGGADFDLDASCFLVGKNGRSRVDGFIFYGNLEGPNKCVVHYGDNLIGQQEGEDGDSEQIFIDLDKVPENIDKIAITVTIYEHEKRHQNFGMVEQSYCRLLDTENDNKEVVRFNLGEDFSVETAIVVGEVYRHNGDWKFNAIGQGFSGGLQALCKNYGIDAEYQ